MDNLTSSFSMCSDGSIAFSISCTGPDCFALQGFPGLTCTSDSSSTTCSSGAGCSGPSVFTSSLDLLESDSTFYATNTLQFDCETDTFVVNGTTVGPLLTEDSPCLNGSSGYATTTSTVTATAVVPCTNATTQSMRHTPSPTFVVQQSSGSSHFRKPKHCASSALVSLALMVVLSLFSPLVAAHETHAHHQHHEQHLELRDLQPRGYIGPAISDLNNWYGQLQTWINNSPEGNIWSSLFSAASTETDFWSGLLDDGETLACQVLLDYVETGLIRQVLFKQQWQKCVANVETNVRGRFGLNGTSVKITPELTLQFVAGAKVACDFMFAKLIQDVLGFDPENTICDLDTSLPLSGGQSTSIEIVPGGGGSTPKTSTSSEEASTTPASNPSSSTASSSTTTVTTTTTSSSAASTTVSAIYSFQDFSACSAPTIVDGQAQFCSCDGAWISQDTWANLCADVQPAPSCPSGKVVWESDAETEFDTGVECSSAHLGCNWAKTEYQWECCDCPAGYINSFDGACGTKDYLPDGPCVGCEDPAATLVGDRASGYKCVM